MIFEALVSGNFRNDGLRVATTVAAIALAVGLLLAVQLTTSATLHAFEGTVRVISDQVNLQIVGGPRGFDERVLLTVRRLADVSTAAPIVEGSLDVRSPRRSARSTPLQIVGVDSLQPLPGEAPRSGEFPGPFAPRGSGPDPALMIGGNGIVLSERFARRLGLQVGDHLDGIQRGRVATLTVAKIASPPLAGIDPGIAFVDIATAQELFGTVGRLSRIDCIVPAERLRGVRNQLKALLPPGVRAIEPPFGMRALQHILTPLRLAFGLLLVVAIVVAGLLTYNGVAASVVQRRVDIGTLRALGASRRAIFWAFVGEGGILGGIGALLGFLLGSYLARDATVFFLRSLQSSYGPLPIPDAAGDPLASMGAVAFGLSIALVTAALPAYAAARTPPADSLRWRGTEPTASHLGASVLLFGIAAALGIVAGVVAVRAGDLRWTIVAVAALAFASVAAIPPVITVLARTAKAGEARIPPAVRIALETLASAPRRVTPAIAATMFATAATLSTLIVASSARFTIGTLVEHAIGTSDARATAVAAFESPFAAASAVGASITALALLGAVAMLYAFVLEHRREIAILRWLGMSRRGVRALVVCEAVTMGAVGALLGCLFGLSATALFMLGPAPGALGVPLMLHVPYGAIVGLIIAVTATIAAAALYPAKVAARILSDAELRVA